VPRQTAADIEVDQISMAETVAPKQPEFAFLGVKSPITLLLLAIAPPPWSSAAENKLL
jgi:hypothetical protein